MSVAANEPLRARFAYRERLARVADCLVVGVAVSLPWSTTATGILVAAWLLVLIPTLDLAAVRRELATPAGALPVALWGLAVVGMLWADVPLSERLAGLGSFHKLLVIPLLMAQFRRSGGGSWVLFGFLISCGVMLAVSFVLVLLPGLSWRGKMTPGVPVKDYISQGTLFSVCVVLMADLALAAWRQHRRAVAFGCGVMAALFLANLVYVLPSRTPLVVVPILLLVFVFKRWPLKQAVGLLAAALVLLVAAWWSAPVLRDTVYSLYNEVYLYRLFHAPSRSGERLEFWTRSLGFMHEAPVIGHGTGSITEQFRKAVAGKAGLWAQVSTNPHNQALAVGIQLGLVGIAVLFAMWIAHLLLFRGGELAAFAGLVIVAQNIVGSLFNSHLFDFTQGWLYVMGVGVAAGIVRRLGVGPPQPQ